MYLQRVVSGMLFSPLLLGLSLVTFGLAARNVVRFGVSADVIDLAASLERGHAMEEGYISNFIANRPGFDDFGGCGDAASRARLSVALAALREADLSDDGARVTLALERAEAASRARLACAPTDGNAWLQWATVELRAAGPVPNVIAAMRNSARFAPSERWIVEPRLDVETRLSAAGAAALEPQYAADLRQFVEFEAPKTVAAVYVGHNGAVRDRMRSMVLAQPTRRRQEITFEIDRLGVEVSKP